MHVDILPVLLLVLQTSVHALPTQEDHRHQVVSESSIDKRYVPAGTWTRYTSGSIALYGRWFTQKSSGSMKATCNTAKGGAVWGCGFDWLAELTRSVAVSASPMLVHDRPGNGVVSLHNMGLYRRQESSEGEPVDWASLPDVHQAQARDIFAVPDLYLHSIVPAPEGIDNGYMLQYAHDPDSDPHMFHSTNGTHGSVYQTSSPASQTKRALYNFGKGTLGVKMNWIMPCASSALIAHQHAFDGGFLDTMSQMGKDMLTQAFDLNQVQIEMATTQGATMIMAEVQKVAIEAAKISGRAVSWGPEYEPVHFAQNGRCF